MRNSDVEERPLRAASEARERGTESRRDGRATAWLRKNASAESPPAVSVGAPIFGSLPKYSSKSRRTCFVLKRKSDVEERSLRAASEARERGTESRRDDRAARGFQTERAGSIHRLPLQRTQERGAPAYCGDRRTRDLSSEGYAPHG